LGIACSAHGLFDTLDCAQDGSHRRLTMPPSLRIPSDAVRRSLPSGALTIGDRGTLS
jgi:hypothetical protein